MKELVRTTTLKELDQDLPILPLLKGEKNKFEKERSFSFLEWDMKLEEEFAKLQEENISQGQLVNKILCRLLDQYCGRDFQKLSDNEKMLIINQEYFANVIYMYTYLRVEELGHELILNVACPYCKKEVNKYECDLRTMDVDCKDKENKRVHEYNLKKPILYKGKVITGFKYDLAKWDFIEGIKADKNLSNTLFKKRMFYSSIVGFLDSKGLIETFIDKKEVIDKMKKYDIEKFLIVISENNGGPSMVTQVDCPHCSNTFQKIIDWSYQNFFGISSL